MKVAFVGKGSNGKTPERARWMITAQDDTIQTGLEGLRLFAEPGIMFIITAFKEIPITRP